MTTLTSPTLTCGADRLASALAPIMSLIPDRPSIPAYGYLVLSQIGNNLISVMGGNAYQRLFVVVGGLELNDDGSFVAVVEATPFYSLLRACGTTAIQLVVEAGSLTFITAGSSSSFPTIPAKDVPSLGLDTKTEGSVMINEASAHKLAQTLLNLNDYTKKTSAEFNSPLAGIWLTPVDGFLRATAFEQTCGSDDTLPIEWSLSEPLFLPNDSIVPLAKMMASCDGYGCLLESRENWIGLNVDENQIWLRKQQVTCPPLDQLWPKADDKGFTGNWTVEKLALIQSLKRIGSLPGLPSKTGVSHLAEFHANDGAPQISYRFESYHASEAVGEYDGPEPDFATGMGIDTKKLLTVASSFAGSTLYFSLNPTNERQRVIYVSDESSHKRALFMLLATNLH